MVQLEQHSSPSNYGTKPSVEHPAMVRVNTDLFHLNDPVNSS